MDITISHIQARQILDSRGNPTIEADVILSNGILGRAAVPSGASTGVHEAVELRDNDKTRYGGKGVIGAVKNVNSKINQLLVGSSPFQQVQIDKAMCDLDGTDNKSNLGANAILAVSLAVVKAAALSQNKPLYQYIGEISGTPIDQWTIPLPMMNVMNGGQHALGATDIQEYMIIPIGAKNFPQALRMGAEIFHTLGKILKEKDYPTTVGDEGGYAPRVKNGNAEPIELILQAIEKAGYTPKEDVVLALDVAASEFYQKDHYNLITEKRTLTAENMIDWYKEMIKKYPLISIEDGLDQDDWENWKKLNSVLGEKIQLVGDDLLVTNSQLLKKAISQKSANSILIKPNQIGTLSETIEAIQLAKNSGWKTVISHRSGETEDTTIAHLAVGLGLNQIKTGSLSRSERIAKYNELLRINQANPAITFAKPLEIK